jgi:hypothetical protein
MAIGPGPGKGKNKQASKPLKASSKSGQMVAAQGYGMGLIRNEKAMKEPTKTKTSGEGAKAVSVTTKAGIIGPKPTGPGGKVATAPAKKKGTSAVGKAVKKIGRDIDYAASQVKNALTPSVQKRGTFKSKGGGGRRGGKTCAAYR